MAEERVQRRLSAILAADVVGYSRLIRADEEGTLARLRSIRDELIDPSIARHDGRIVKTMGDGMLIEFPSVVDAVRSAVEVQQSVAAREADVPEDRCIVFRVGINLGDVVIDGDDIHGDGVNVAARLEGLADPGGICVSGAVHDQVRDRIDLTFEDLGEQEVKNIDRPIRVWRWTTDTSTTASGPATTDQPLPLPDKPSIAVLPFENMSGDPEQEYFTDGIAEDVITALSRFRSLFVIARNSSFTYKGPAVDIAQVAKDLGVRYVVEGSVRKAGDRVRITAQLIDASDAKHLWADRFDGILEDIFDLQDQITEQIVVAVEPEIGARERERARRKPPESLDAWDLVQRGLTHFLRVNRADRMEAIRLFEKAIASDPEFARAYAHLAYARLTLVTLGYTENVDETVPSAKKAAEKVLSLDTNEPLAHYTLGQLHIYAGDIEMAIGEMRTAIAVNPNSALSHFGLGFAHHYGAGEAEQALTHYDTALRLSPRDPMRWMTLMLKGSALRFLGRHDEAIVNCRKACQFPDRGPFPYMHLAATLAAAGKKSEARVALARAIEIEPNFSVNIIRDRFVGMHELTLNNLLDGLRMAGLPD
jgi:adenylate cyclase